MRPAPMPKDAFAEQLLQHMPVPAFVLDTRHRVLIWNKACERLTGLKAEDMIGTDRHWQGFYPAPRPCLADLLLDRSLGKLDSLYEIAGDVVSDTGTLHTEN